jgi:Flp pilus assembly secretin CpaC
MRFELGAHGRRRLGAALVSIAAIVASSAAVAQEMIDVTIDFAKLIKLDEPAKDVFVGNPGIADANIADENTLLITGKAAGVTNLIVLDEDGNEIERAVLRVASDVQQLTTVFKAGQRQTFSCSPVCEQVISVGDAKEVFTQAAEQIQGRATFSTGQ